MCPTDTDWVLPSPVPYYSFIGRSSDAKEDQKRKTSVVDVYGASPIVVGGFFTYTIACKAYVDFTVGLVSGVAITAAGTGYTSAPTITPSGGGGTGFAAQAITNTAGNVVGIVITSFGTGYTTAPTLAFSGGGGGSGATATVTINDYSSIRDLPLFTSNQVNVRVSPVGNGAGTRKPNFVGTVVPSSVAFDMTVTGLFAFTFQAEGSGQIVSSVY